MKIIIKKWAVGIRQYAITHKVISAVVVVGLIWGGSIAYGKVRGGGQATRYIAATAEKGTIVVAVTGSGQVSASNQVDIKSKVSGDVTSIYVKQGQAVKKGAYLAQLDASDSQKAVRDARNSLQSAQLSLQKLQISQQADIPSLQAAVITAQNNSFRDLTDTFLQLPNVANDIHDILYGNTLKGGCTPNYCQYSNYISASVTYSFEALRAKARDDESAAQAAYTAALNDYKRTDQNSGADAISKLMGESINASQLIAQAVKSEQNMLDAVIADMTSQAILKGVVVNIPAQISTYKTAISTDIGVANSALSNLRSSQNAAINAAQSLSSAEQSNPIDVATQQNSVAQREAALSDALATLANSTIRAPFDGVVAKVSVKLSDSVSSSAAIMTMVTTQQLATLTLNEVDAAKIAVDQPVTLTFDAVPDLTIAGKVATVDTIGTVSQGVVTYSVNIAFATQDSRIKPGMSVNASIATQVKTDALMVPSGAVKSQGAQQYVLVIDGDLPAGATSQPGYIPATLPHQVIVQTGLSDDSNTEITSGITEGTNVVSRTITTTAVASTAPSLLNAAGVRGGATGGGTFRAPTTGR